LLIDETWWEMSTLYHRTSVRSAQAILEGGFRDSRHHFGFKSEDGTKVEVEGVWLSNVPLDGNDFGDADRHTLLAVTLDDQDLIDCEVVEEGDVRRYREWLVPAAVINARGKVRLVLPAEEEAASARRWK
jgi:hypothetical protein